MPYKGDVYHICVCMYVKYINASYEKVGFGGGGTKYIYGCYALGCIRNMKILWKK